MSEGPAPTASGRDEPLSDRLERLWRRGERPDPCQFLADAGPCTPAAAAEVLALDQWLRWQAGERVRAESYLRRRPEVAADAELALQLVYGEFLVREALGEQPTLGEYQTRFPAFADRLGQQFELHRALQTDTDLLGAHAPGDETPSPHPGSAPTLRPAAPPGTTAGIPVGAARTLVLPEEFGRYRIVKVLGSGGMATVYLAEDSQLGRPVALKVPRFDETSDVSLVERFYREARIAATFHHPNLCPVYDVGRENGVHYLTMPLLPGEPLSELIRREGPLPQARAVRLAARIARAMQAAHAEGVIHRDLKPANIMVNERGEPVVMDFGLARRAAVRDPRLTNSRVVLGTPLYTPPEQIWGEPAGMGPAGDVYSLGVILYEMLTGRVPFRGALHEVLERVLTQPPEPPSVARADLDPRLERACLTAMAKDPGARFASMADFAAALEGLLEQDGPGDSRIRLSTPGAAGKAPRARPRSRRRWFIAALGVGTLAAAAWLAAAPRVPGRRAVPAADPLPAGSRWAGGFRFVRTSGQEHEIVLSVESRSGPRFRGVCATEGGAYQWGVEGTIDGEDITWSYTRVILEKDDTGSLADKHVKGTCRDGVIKALYVDSDSAANLELRRVAP